MDQKHRNRRPARSGLAFESLESRLLLSADLAPVADALASEPSLVPAEHRALEAFEPAPSISMRIEAHELVFVDGSIAADRDRLLADFVRATGADRAVEVVVLDPDGDGVAQIGAALASRKGLTAVHVLSHGRQGAIDLGATTLDTATLAARADAIAAWAAAFAADGDLLLFGCDVAGSLQGESFVDELARLTGADVAASDDATGDPGLGGDWALEYATGAIEAALAPLAQAAWGGLLTTEVLDWDDPAVDWPAAAIGSNNFAAGGANVTITVTDPAGQLNNGSPDDDVLNDQGGLGATEQGLYVSSNGFLPGESSTITIDFAHAGGVSNVSFTIFDIDRGGGPNFIDEIQASFTASGAVTLAIANGPSNIVLGGDTVQGTAGAPSNGANSGDANATFTFTGSGITQVTLNYRNVGGATGQSITLHDISFDPTPTAGDRAVAMNEDTAYTFTAGDFGFADAGGDTLQAVWITQLETAGSLLLNGVDVVLNQVVSIADINANLLTFAPVADANGAPYANLRFQVGDGASFSVADYQLRIDLGAVNDAPTLAIGANQTVAEGAAAQTVVGFATAAPGGGADEAGQTFAYTVTNDNNALFAVQPSIAGNGTLTYTLAANAIGTANVSVSVTDSGGTLNGGIDTSAASAFTITATPVADTPSVTNAATLEDAQTIAGLVISSNPADGAEVTHFRITGIAGGTLFLSDGTTAIANGTFITIAAGAAGLKFTPTLNAVAGGSFDVQASTAANVAGLGGGVITASIAVTAVNDAPTLAVGANQTVAEDAPAQTVVGFATAAPGGGADEAGETFSYAVTNDNNAMFAVQPSIAPNGTLTYTLAANAFGTANVTVSVTDSGGTLSGGIDTSAASAFTITATPVADTPSVTNAATLEDVQTLAGLLISRNAADGAEVSHFRITGIAGGTLFLNDGTTAVANGDFITVAQGAAGLKFTPAANSIAGGNFDIQASTAANVAGLGGGVITAAIAVTPVNDAPALAIGANQTVAEDAAAQTVMGFATAAPGGGADEAGQTFTYAVANDNNAMFAVQPSIAANGTLTYALAADVIGTANVSVTVTDSGGTLNGGIDTTGALAFSITATPVADTPSVTNAATLEDVQTTAGLVISRNPADGAEVSHFRITGIAGGALFLNDGTTAVANGDFITVAQGAAGLKFTPTPNAVAGGSFDMQASTAANVAGLGGGVVTATIAVTPVNDEPSFTIGPNQALAEDAAAQTIAGFAVALPGGGADEAAQTFTYTVTNDNNALFTVQPAVAANGTLTYTLAANASGAATVTLFVTDSGGTLNGGDDTAPAQTFTVTVTPVADAPTLTVNPATGNEDTAIALAVTTALVDADGSEALAVTVSSVPVGATLSDGVNSFTATAGSQTTAITGWKLAQLRVTPPTHSDVDFTLAIAATATETANGATATSNANLLVRVAAAADAPTINLGPAAGNEDTAIALTLGAVLVDADGSESLALALSGIPVGATLLDGVNSFTATAGNQAVNLAGWNLAALTVTPPANADADFTLTVTATATEGANGSTAASVAGLLVDVLPVNDAPTVAAPAAIAVVEDVASPLLGISFGDVDAGAGLVTAAFGVAQGTLSATAGGGVAVGGTATALTLTGTLADVNAFLAGAGLRYMTALDTTAPVALTASLNDLGNTGAGGAAASPNANVTLNVIPVNDAPVLGNVTLTVDAGGTVVLTSANLGAADVDDPLAGLVFFIAGLENGRFELAGNPGVAALAFTQGQVTAGQVKFVQTDALRAPSYLVFVTDGVSTVGPGIVALTFRPLFEAGGGDANKARDDGLLPAVSFASGGVDTSRGGLVDPFAIRFNRQPVVPTDGGSAAIAEAETVAPAAGGRQTLAKPDNVWELRSRGSFETRLVSAEMDKLLTAIPTLDFGLGPQRPHEEPRGLTVALDAVRTAGLVVSVGAVWWASRAAGLISSLLAITPTWRHIDPLPVLGRDDDETNGGWDDPVGDEATKEEASASEMFDGGAKKPASV